MEWVTKSLINYSIELKKMIWHIIAMKPWLLEPVVGFEGLTKGASPWAIRWLNPWPQCVHSALSKPHEHISALPPGVSPGGFTSGGFTSGAFVSLDGSLALLLLPPQQVQKGMVFTTWSWGNQQKLYSSITVTYLQLMLSSTKKK